MRTTGNLHPARWEEDRLLQSKDTAELISQRPHLFLRWGTTILLSIATGVLIAAWFIRYPDIITTQGILTTINAPKEVRVKQPGKLIRLFVDEGEPVARNAVLGFMESTASHEQVMCLSQLLDTVSGRVNRHRTDGILRYLALRFDSLGEIQAAYQVFAQSLQEFGNYQPGGFYQHKRRMLSADMHNLRRLHDEQLRQKKMLQEDLSLAETTYDAQESLKKRNIISAFDLRNERSKLLARRLTLPQVNAAIISNEGQQNEKTKEIDELENQVRQQEIIFAQALNTFKSGLEDWKRKYVLTAPIAGSVSFAAFLQEGQELRAGQILCYISPGNTSYYAEILIPQYNSGKIRIGQEVLLKFPAYPWQEFGSVKGYILFINTAPADSGYIAKLSLPNGLSTTYRKVIRYRAGLVARAEIITNDLRLLERFVNTLSSRVSVLSISNPILQAIPFLPKGSPIK